MDLPRAAECDGWIGNSGNVEIQNLGLIHDNFRIQDSLVVVQLCASYTEDIRTVLRVDRVEDRAVECRTTELSGRLVVPRGDAAICIIYIRGLSCDAVIATSHESVYNPYVSEIDII